MSKEFSPDNHIIGVFHGFTSYVLIFFEAKHSMLVQDAFLRCHAAKIPSAVVIMHPLQHYIYLCGIELCSHIVVTQAPNVLYDQYDFRFS